MNKKTISADLIEQLNRELNFDDLERVLHSQYDKDMLCERLSVSWLWFRAGEIFFITACSDIFERGVRDCRLLNDSESILGWDIRKARFMFPSAIDNYLAAARKVFNSGLPTKWVNPIDRGFVNAPPEAHSNDSRTRHLVSRGEVVLHILYKNSDDTLTCLWR